MTSAPRKSTVPEISRVTSKLSGLSRLSRGSLTDPLQMMYFHRMFRAGKGGFRTPLYQNTYRLKPMKPFIKEVADEILANVMNDMLKNKEYDATESVSLCKEMAAEVQDGLYKKNYDRYKIIVTMVVIQKTEGGVFMCLSHLWDAQRDNYSTYVFENNTLYAVGIVSAIYFE